MGPSAALDVRGQSQRDVALVTGRVVDATVDATPVQLSWSSLTCCPPRRERLLQRDERAPDMPTPAGQALALGAQLRARGKPGLAPTPAPAGFGDDVGRELLDVLGRVLEHDLGVLGRLGHMAHPHVQAGDVSQSDLVACWPARGFVSLLERGQVLLDVGDLASAQSADGGLVNLAARDRAEVIPVLHVEQGSGQPLRGRSEAPLDRLVR